MKKARPKGDPLCPVFQSDLDGRWHPVCPRCSHHIAPAVGYCLSCGQRISTACFAEPQESHWPEMCPSLTTK